MTPCGKVAIQENKASLVAITFACGCVSAALATTWRLERAGPGLFPAQLLLKQLLLRHVGAGTGISGELTDDKYSNGPQ